ncbi:cupin domain-containing protein [Streptomyces sp. NPDC001348]
MTILADQGKAAPGAQPFFDLARLISPIDPETFRRDHWETQPLLVERADPNYYAELLTLDDVDELISLAGANLDCIRVVADGKETPVQDLGGHGPNGRTAVLEALYDRYRSGSTIVLNAMERRWDPLGRLTTALSAEASARFQVNVYLTPGGEAQGFKPHYDTHDVFVLQVHGTKRWRLYGMPYPLPFQDQPFNHADPEVPDVEREIDLTPGSLLYLPRGTVHAATSTDTASVHITLGAHPILWSYVLQQAIAKVAAEDVRFRTGLPYGFARSPELQQQAEKTLAELLRSVVDQASPQAAIDDAVDRAVSISPPRLRHHLTDLEAVSDIGPDTKLRRRPDLRWDLKLTDDRVRLSFHNKTVEFPLHVADEVTYVAASDGEPISPSSIPGTLDQSGRLVLIRTLLREGFLTLR